MKRWWLGALAIGAMAVLIGCGGRDARSGVIIPGDGEGRLVPTFVLNEPGTVSTFFLSGQGRRQQTSQIAQIRQFRYESSAGDFIPDLDYIVNLPLRIKLDEYRDNDRRYTVPVPPGRSFRAFDLLPFEVFAIEEVDANGVITPLTSTSPAVLADPPFPLRLAVFRGRTTSVQINLDDAILSFDPARGVLFDTALFEVRNLDVQTGTIRGFFSDYVAFDLSDMPDSERPELSSGLFADRVLFSGDGICISRGLGPNSEFEFLNPVLIEAGKIFGSVDIGGVPSGGTFNLLEDDPRELNDLNIPELAKLTALKGTWRPHNQAIISRDIVTAVAFPNTDEAFLTPGELVEQQFVIYQENRAGRVNAMWQGVVRYEGTRGEFSVWPISQVDDADAANRVDGVVENLQYLNGVVVNGDWRVTSANQRWPFPLRGSFGVYRR